MIRGRAGGAILAVATLAGVATAQASTPYQQRAVQRLVTALNGRHLAAASALFAPSATLRVDRHVHRGRPAIERWWRAELSHHVHLSLRSRVTVHGAGAVAVLWRTTSGGDCARGCLERGDWRLSGSRFTAMTLAPLRRSSPPTPTLPKTVPPPPSGHPPQGTPTIPT